MVIGLCWRCENDDVPVMWLGPVQSEEQGSAPFHACEPCVKRIEVLVRAHNNRGLAPD